MGSFSKLKNTGIEALGFAGLYRSDHFMAGEGGSDSLDISFDLSPNKLTRTAF
jgi:hypothetical protein